MNCSQLLPSPRPSRRVCRLRLALLLWCGGLTSTAHAQGQPQLVADLNQMGPAHGSLLSGPTGGRKLGNFTYFAAHDPRHGVELWRTDGTAAGTVMVKDINPGAGSSNPAEFAAIGNHLFFRADDGATGAELWRSDGTTAGTALLVDINPGPDGSYLANFASHSQNAVLAFSADDGTHGREMWRTNGTAAGTALVADIRPGSASALTPTTTFVPIIYGGWLFPAYDGVHGEELWTSIGVSAAVLASDINPGGASSMPRHLAEGVWAADDGVHGRELFHGDGTLLADLYAGPESSDPGVFGRVHDGRTERFVFAATSRSVGRELWTWDRSNPPRVLLDVVPGPSGSSPELEIAAFPRGARAVGLFTVTTPATGRELWITDGSTSGTMLVRDIHPGTGSSNPSAFVALGALGRVLFRADDGASGAELWRTDGTAAGTVRVADILPGAASSNATPLVPVGSGNDQRLLLSAIYGANLAGPWISDGTGAGTTLLRAIGVAAPGSDPIQVTDHTGAPFVLYQGDDGLSGRELWRSDGTVAGTVMVKDINPGTADGSPANFAHWNGRTYFSANDGVHNTELWVSDGTTVGTFMLKEIYVGPGFSTPHSFVAFAGLLFFSAFDGNGRELWRTDGTAAGTVMVQDINPGTAGSGPDEFLVVGNRLYFTATTAATGAELWQTDGTAAGTTLVRDINPGPDGSATISPTSRGHEKAALGNQLIFAVHPATGGIYRSDGTSAGTNPILPSMGTLVDVRELVAWNGRVYFAATGVQTATGREVFWTDGSMAALLRDLAFASADSSPTGLTVVGDRLLFKAATPELGRELYRSDGTSAGTVLVKDIYPGPASGVYDAPLPYGQTYRLATLAGSDRALFAASDGNAGVELWRTDGTAEGTVLHADINPGAAGSFPQPFTAALGSGLLFFAATADATGDELYAMTSMATVQAFGAGCAGTGGLVPELGARGLPTLGNNAFSLTVSRGRANSVAAMFVGFGYGRLPLGGGCALQFNLLLPYVPLSTAIDGRGFGSLTFPIPNDRNLQGLAMYAQAAVADPGGSFRNLATFTGGLKMVVDQ